MDSHNTQNDAPSRSDQDNRSIGYLIRKLALEITALVRNEAALARAEVSENVSKLTGGIISLVLAVILLLIGLIGLMDAGIYGLATIWPMWLSALVVGGVIVVLGLIALVIGRSRLKARALWPDRTAGELRKDASFVREQSE